MLNLKTLFQLYPYWPMFLIVYYSIIYLSYINFSLYVVPLPIFIPYHTLILIKPLFLIVPSLGNSKLGMKCQSFKIESLIFCRYQTWNSFTNFPQVLQKQTQDNENELWIHEWFCCLQTYLNIWLYLLSLLFNNIK